MEPKYVQTSEQPGWMPICIHGECDDYMRVDARQIPRLPAAAEVHPLAQQNNPSQCTTNILNVKNKANCQVMRLLYDAAVRRLEREGVCA